VSTAAAAADRVAEIVAAARDGRLTDAPAPAQPHRRIRTIDWRRPSKFNAEQERRIKRLHDTFCQTASVRLGTELRMPVDLEVINIAQLTWSTAHADLQPSAVCAVLEAQPLGTPLVLAAELPFVLFGIERLLGGGAGMNSPERRMTEIDWKLAGRIFAMLTEQLSNIWQDLANLNLSVASVDTQPASATTASVTDPTLSITFEARVARGSATMTLLIPYGSIEQVSERLGGDDGKPKHAVSPEDASGIRNALGEVEVELRAEAGAIMLPIEQVLALKPGDIVPLGAEENGVSVYAADHLVGRARPGRNHNHRAVQLIERAS
jgi:flagellar motor switch protein FliM